MSKLAAKGNKASYDALHARDIEAKLHKEEQECKLYGEREGKTWHKGGLFSSRGCYGKRNPKSKRSCKKRNMGWVDGHMSKTSKGKKIRVRGSCRKKHNSL